MLKSPETNSPRPEKKKRAVKKTKHPSPASDLEGDFNVSAETREKSVEFIINLLLAESACEKVNEGGNGVIMKIDAGQLSPEIKKLLNSVVPGFIGDQEASVMKILKIFSCFGINNEFEKHQLAYEVVSKSPDNDKISVPKPWLSASVKLNSRATIDRCREAGVLLTEANSNPEIALELMDFIEGEDLELYFCKQLILSNPEVLQKRFGNEDPGEFIKYLNDYNLRHYMNEIFADSGSENFRDSIFADDDKFREFLQKKLSYQGVFNKENAAAFKRVMELLKSKKFKHGDLHLRNVMIDKLGKLYLIDFGRSSIAGDNVDESRLNERGERVIPFPDDWLGNFLEAVAKDGEDEKREALWELEEKVQLEDIGKLKQKIEKDAKSRLALAWKKTLANIKSGEDLEETVNGFLLELGVYGTWQSDNSKYWLLVLVEAGRLGRKADVLNYCQKKLGNKNTGSFLRTKLYSLSVYLQ